MGHLCATCTRHRGYERLFDQGIAEIVSSSFGSCAFPTESEVTPSTKTAGFLNGDLGGKPCPLGIFHTLVLIHARVCVCIGVCVRGEICSMRVYIVQV